MTIATVIVMVVLQGEGAKVPFDHESFRCAFTESRGKRVDPKGASSEATKEIFDDLVIDAVDTKRRRARFIGNAGSSTLMVLDGPTAISFLEEAPIGGNVNVLTIVKATRQSNVYAAVYSRHSAFTTGHVTMSQSYGTCRGLM